MNPITSFLVFACVLAGLAVGYWVNPFLAFVFFAAAAIIAMSLKMANVWQKFVVLRMGKRQSVKGAGMFAIIPILDNVVVLDRVELCGRHALCKFHDRIRKLDEGHSGEVDDDHVRTLTLGCVHSGPRRCHYG